MLAIWKVGDPGAQGAGITGTQGMGVNAPNAAAVAAATVGFAIELHMPNGMMLSNGLLSMMFAHGVFTINWLTGRTASDEGAAPKLHCNIAPMHTWKAITQLTFTSPPLSDSWPPPSTTCDAEAWFVNVVPALFVRAVAAWLVSEAPALFVRSELA